MADTVYIVERCGPGRFDSPELVDVYASKDSAKAFVLAKNATNKSRFVYAFRIKKVKA